MEVHLVPAGKSDAASLIKLQEDAFRRLYDIYRDEASPYLKGIPEYMRWLDMSGVSYFKIVADSVLCGGIAYFRRDGGAYYLARVYIHPDFQGRGIAAAAIRLCEEKFPDARRYTLDFPDDQPANRRCYEKAGYADTGERRFINERLTLAIYEKFTAE